MPTRKLRYLLLTLFLTGSASAFSVSRVLPQKQAAHFCRLFINDGEDIKPLSVHVQRVIESNDSLTSEQIFVEYLLRNNNWQSLRIFPHNHDDGTVVWYAPADELPASLGNEHQKYIREVFPRLITEVQAENWSMVDAYIDRMIQYQCRFGGGKLSSQPQPLIIMCFFSAIFIAMFLWQKLRKDRKNYFSSSR